MINKYELALEELKQNFSLQCEGVDKCKDSARSSLNSSGLIIALITLLSNSEECSPLLWIIPIGLYGLMLLIYVMAINPIELTAPIKSDMKVFRKYLLDHEDEKAIKKLIERYIDEIDNNRQRVDKTKNRVKWANWLGFLSIALSIYSYLQWTFN